MVPGRIVTQLMATVACINIIIFLFHLLRDSFRWLSYLRFEEVRETEELLKTSLKKLFLNVKKSSLTWLASPNMWCKRKS